MIHPELGHKPWCPGGQVQTELKESQRPLDGMLRSCDYERSCTVDPGRGDKIDIVVRAR